MELQLPRGTRDFPPEERILRDKVVGALKRVFERYGFNPLETPIMERWDVLTAKYGASAETDVMKEVYKLTDQGNRELGLRFDLTVPTARFVGMNPQLKMPFKRYQVGDVFRDGPVKLGRYREFTQCDFDTFGCKKMTADAEIIQVFLAAFTDLDLDATLSVNNRKLLNALIQAAGVPESKAESAMITIDKLDKQGVEGVRKELEEKQIADDAITKLLGFIQVQGTNEEKLKTITGYLPKNCEGLAEMKEVLGYLKDKRVVFTPALARGLAYYTGTVFEGTFNESEVTSSICGGGRYDKLVGDLLGSDKSVPAVGGSFGLEPITEQLKLKAKGQQGGLRKSVVELFVIPIKCYEKALEVVQRLRAAGVATEADLQRRGISKNLEYANALDIPYVLIVGPKELEAGKLKLKDMRTGEEELLPVEEIERKLTPKLG